jgi:transcriptional regulator with XRE-family HTH domain
MATTPLGNALRDAREARGWSRATLADASGTSEPAISRTELYGNQPRLATLEAWASALEIPLVVLLNASDTDAWDEFKTSHGCCLHCWPTPTWHGSDPCPNAKAVAS